MARRRKAQPVQEGPVRAGDKIQVSAESCEGSGKRKMLRAVVVRKYRRWALVQTEAGYKTSVWLDGRGWAVT